MRLVLCWVNLLHARVCGKTFLCLHILYKTPNKVYLHVQIRPYISHSLKNIQTALNYIQLHLINTTTPQTTLSSPASVLLAQNAFLSRRSPRHDDSGPCHYYSPRQHDDGQRQSRCHEEQLSIRQGDFDYHSQQERRSQRDCGCCPWRHAWRNGPCCQHVRREKGCQVLGFGYF